MKNKLVEVIMNAGVDKVLFLVPLRPIRTVFGMLSYTSSTDTEVLMPCRIIEDRYPVKDQYKIRVQSLLSGFGKREFDISDLQSMVRDGRIEMFIKNVP